MVIWIVTFLYMLMAGLAGCRLAASWGDDDPGSFFGAWVFGLFWPILIIGEFLSNDKGRMTH